MSKNFSKFLAIFAIIIFFLFSASTAHAETTFNVNSTIDTVDANPGNGICETSPGNGICTLRAAIQETNALPGSDIIELPAGDYNLALSGQNEDLSVTGDLDIRSGLKIIGAGPYQTKIGGIIDRVFDIRTGAGEMVELDGVRISGGLINALGWQHGAGIRSIGDILKITNSIISGNRITDSQYAPSYGGGIYASNNQLVITDSEISGNGVESMRWASGAGIISAGNLTIDKSIIKDNYIQSGASVEGGGIWIKQGSNFSINESIIWNNYASAGAGGGIRQSGNTSGSITNSTINGNNAGQGGGISSSGNLTITNTTFVGNLAYGGGAIQHSSLMAYGSPRLNIINTTFFDNFAYNNAGESISDIVDGVEHENTYIVNSILSSRTNKNCVQPITSLGHNLSKDSTCGLTNTGDLQNTDPLGTLQYLYWPTVTYALLQNSPAIDHGDPDYCPPTDQRGVTRPQGPQCDIGAYEAEPFNQPPTANAGPDQTVNEGQQTTFDGNSSTDPDGTSDIVSYVWNFGDGNSGNGISPTHIYIDNGTYTATLIVTDTAGETSSDTAIITVNNVAPTATFTVSPTTIIQTQSSTLSFSNQFDPSPIDIAAGFTYSYDCTNDGVFEQIISSSPTFTCSYLNSGIYTAKGSIQDKDGGYTDYLATVTVQTPSEATQDLIGVVETFNLQQGIENSLDAKLDAVLNALDDLNVNNNQAAINSLQAFINAVEAQRGDKITSEQADILIAAAQAIINSLQ